MVEIQYKIIKNNNNLLFNNNKLWSHLHCYDINKFNEMYGKYINIIKEFFSIIITYCINTNIPDLDVIILKTPNKGMDIGAKMCAIDFINSKNIQYEFIFMLHSKSNTQKREEYFKPFFNNIYLILDILKKNNNIGIICPLINLYYGNKNLNIALKNNALIDSWGLNEYWMNYIIKKYNITNENYLFPEGNNYILNKDIANFIFDNRFGIYSQLNTINSFDFNWVKIYHRLDKLQIKDSDINKYYLENKLFGNNLETKLGHDGLADAMIEHAFERIIISICIHLNRQVLMLKNNNIITDRLIRFFKINHLKNLFQII